MHIGGFQKLTLIDYPGKLATTVFTVGCNFRCPFCHNPELVDLSLPHAEETEDKFFSFLQARRGKLEGVCITGGEPTIQPDIMKFIRKIRLLDYAVKLDTNGARPDVIKKLIDEHLLDYIAMDIKNSPGRYPVTAGEKQVDIERIKLSTELVRNSNIEYEFRTTVVPGIHTLDDFKNIGRWLHGARCYVLQPFRSGKILNPVFFRNRKKTPLDLREIRKLMEKNFKVVEIRG